MSDLPLPIVSVLPSVESGSENGLYQPAVRSRPLLVCVRCSERAKKLVPTRHEFVMGSRDDYRCTEIGCGLIRRWG